MLLFIGALLPSLSQGHKTHANYFKLKNCHEAAYTTLSKAAHDRGGSTSFAFAGGRGAHSFEPNEADDDELELESCLTNGNYSLGEERPIPYPTHKYYTCDQPANRW